MSKFFLGIVNTLLVFSADVAEAQDSTSALPAIATDRPDQTECPFIVPIGHFQMENGFVYQHNNEPEVNSYTYLYPSTLLKYGVHKRLELRAVIEHEGRTEYVPEKQFAGTQLSPVKVGFKVNLLEEKGLIPLTSLIVHLGLPFLASKESRDGHIAPTFRFLMQHTLSKKVTLAYNLGAEWETDDHVTTWVYTLTSGYAFSEKVGAYVEAYGFLSPETTADHRIDGGITYFLRPNVMFDVSAGKGVTPAAADYFLGLGFSFRLPN